jgi:hypothetical protein
MTRLALVRHPIPHLLSAHIAIRLARASAAAAGAARACRTGRVLCGLYSCGGRAATRAARRYATAWMSTLHRCIASAAWWRRPSAHDDRHCRAASAAAYPHRLAAQGHLPVPSVGLWVWMLQVGRRSMDARSARLHACTPCSGGRPSTPRD